MNVYLLINLIEGYFEIDDSLMVMAIKERKKRKMEGTKRDNKEKSERGEETWMFTCVATKGIFPKFRYPLLKGQNFRRAPRGDDDLVCLPIFQVYNLYLKRTT